jgi:uncharacterized membrane protein YhaH (DUF805 family)
VFILALLAIGVFIGSMYFLGKVFDRYAPNCIFGIAGLFSILVIDVLFVIYVRRWHPAEYRTKISKKALYITVFAISVSALIWWYIAYVFRQAMH